MRMKKLKSVVLFLWLSLFAGQAGANLLVNPGFESGMTGWLEWGTGTYSTSVDTFGADILELSLKFIKSE